MTVIFHTSAGAPVLAGDMLLSVPGHNIQTDLRLPSHPNGIVIPRGVLPDYIPVRMRRKIFIVNDHMAVGAAGPELNVGSFINDLIKEFRGTNIFTFAEIDSFLSMYATSQWGAEILESVGYLVLVEASDWRGAIIRELNEPREVKSKLCGRVVAIGTGSDSIIHEVGRLDNFRTGMSQPSDAEEQFPEFRTLAVNLTLLANVYWKEFVKSETVFEAWGGAYDLIYQDSKKVFHFLDEYTIFLRRFDVDQADEGIQLKNVLRYERRSDFSFISMLNNGQLDFFAAKDITASDTPLTATLGGSELTMNSKIHISIIEVGKGNRLLRPMIQIDGLDSREETKQTVFTWINEEQRLCVAFHAEHDEWLKEQARNYYQENAARFS